MRIAFMGTPEFGVPSLTKLHDSGHEIVLVVTQPDRPAGRGRKIARSAIKSAALELGLPIDQPESVNADDFVDRLRSLRPDLVVVVAFGQILSEELLAVPSMGSVNLHASLLPRYRGVAPINWAIAEGESETGVTTMFMARKVDAGEIILTRSTRIGERETAGELSGRLSQLGAEVLLETVELIERSDAPRIKQDPELATYARKLRKSDGEIDWTKPSRRVYDRIRGMTPWPGAYTWYRGRVLRVLRAAPGGEGERAGAPGEIVGIDRERGIEVAVADGTVLLLEVQPEGKGAMSADAFARGYRPEVGSSPFVRPPDQGGGDAAG
jgi:methionyl-tRNA formyltransferase